MSPEVWVIFGLLVTGLSGIMVATIRANAPGVSMARTVKALQEENERLRERLRELEAWQVKAERRLADAEQRLETHKAEFAALLKARDAEIQRLQAALYQRGVLP